MPQSPRRSNYLDVAALAALVREHRRTGVVPEALAQAMMQIAGGVWDRYRHTPERDDFVQEAVLHLLGSPLRKCDPRQHVFNYFTTCALRYGIKLRDRANRERRQFEEYAQAIVTDGYPIPNSPQLESHIRADEAEVNDDPFSPKRRRTFNRSS